MCAPGKRGGRKEESKNAQDFGGRVDKLGRRNDFPLGLDVLADGRDVELDGLDVETCGGGRRRGEE